MGSCNNFKPNDDFMNQYMNWTYNSYSEYKNNYEESKLQYLIHKKYLKILGRFIDTMYPGLKFDIFIRNRNPKQRKPDWYGMTYMELRIFDVITSPIYNPSTFEPAFKTPNYKDPIYSEKFFNDIQDFIPEINKHLLISYAPLIDQTLNISDVYLNSIPDFECWTQYWKHSHRKTYEYDIHSTGFRMF
jgi:hypothetical protein